MRFSHIAFIILPVLEHASATLNIGHDVDHYIYIYIYIYIYNGRHHGRCLELHWHVLKLSQTEYLHMAFLNKWLNFPDNHGVNSHINDDIFALWMHNKVCVKHIIYACSFHIIIITYQFKRILIVTNFVTCNHLFKYNIV